MSPKDPTARTEPKSERASGEPMNVAAAKRDPTRFDPDLFLELERRSAMEIQRLRTHERTAMKVAVIATPGNSSDLGAFETHGITVDVSRGGCRAIFSTPLRVGDVHRLAFDRESLDVPLVFARCVRCRMLREDAFEAGFSFFAPIEFGERGESARSQARDLFA